MQSLDILNSEDYTMDHVHETEKTCPERQCPGGNGICLGRVIVVTHGSVKGLDADKSTEENLFEAENNTIGLKKIPGIATQIIMGVEDREKTDLDHNDDDASANILFDHLPRGFSF
jgi:hypothetical protein